MKPDKNYYITTAITYTSGKPHIGNTYEIILADAIARLKRQQGYKVYFQTGTDEHGQKIETKAKDQQQSPQQFVDEKAKEVKDIWDLMNTSYDAFIRTTDENHMNQVQKIFKKLYDQGDIYLGHYTGKYCTACESFFTESQVSDEKCPDCSGPVNTAKEEAYFFKLSKYADRLMKHIEDHPEFIQPESRKKEMINNFLKPGLQDLCVSRTTFRWSIPVDFNPDHVIYVWIDALTNYITGLGYDVNGNSKQMYDDFWPANVQIIGKDIVRFHTIYWPIVLMALDLPLPKQVFGHPWLLQGENKMSKSKGNVIYADALVDIYGVDAVRYYLLHEIPYDNDGTITWELLTERVNADLVNVLSNLVHRTITMVNKYFDGKITNPSVLEPIDQELETMALSMSNALIKKMDEFRVAEAMDEIFILLRRTNKYIDETTPWLLSKDENKQDRLATVLYHLIETIRFCAISLEPFMPETANKILDQLGTDKRTLDTLHTFGQIQDGTKVTSHPVMLFTRFDIEEITKNTIKEETQIIEPEITIDDFKKVRLQVGIVESCDKHPKADKLLVLQVNVGGVLRQIVSGIANSYTSEAMIGKKVLVITNLKTTKIRGIASQGMLLAGSSKDKITVVEIDGLESGTFIE